MDSPRGNSCGSTRIHNSGSDEDLMDQRKRKRMESNRESARRSRMKKQKHLDDQMDRINRLKNNNNQMIVTMEVITQQFLEIEAQNSVLRVQIGELSQRLDSLNEILNYMKNNSNDYAITHCTDCINELFEFEQFDHFLNHSWNMMYINQHPIMASASDVLQY
ncbi:hypothetical protein L6452_39335 [Arctium lappa]|uniref:Uncharacterized protein n=1 Tax=Arctium lappa TaxID=4217 RepID=A0ACB8XT60_ARCLA|nr:hypothetical protein L6452_39335 [Arctium lappa]